jgi:ribosomal protein L11 methyltransferase
MKKYQCFRFSTENEAQSEILIAHLDTLEPIGFKEEDNDVYVYFDQLNYSKNEIDLIAETLNLRYEETSIEEENWNAKWESGFEPISVLDPRDQSLFAYIRASFHDVNEKARFNIEITPKMSFGTGHHATTYLMIEAMCSLDFKDKNVIDFGTGTGVLAILAEKMGAKNIMAIDNDDWSIENTRENTEKNNCKNLILHKADGCVTANDFLSEIILANINFNVIIDNLEAIKSKATKDAIVLFSGILEEDVTNLSKELTKGGFYIHEVNIKNGWAMIYSRLN